MTSVAQHAPCRTVVIDTNLVLDLWGFGDAAAVPWLDAVAGTSQLPQLQWLATAAMRDELLTVLARTHLQQAFAKRGRSAADVAGAFDRHAHIVAAPAPLPQGMRVHCTDADDQKFIDLALAHQALLLSKDKAVLRCKKRLAARGVVVQTVPLIPQQ